LLGQRVAASDFKESVLTSPPENPAIFPEVLTLSTAQRVAAMLDLDPSSIVQGMALPRGWHFPLMPAMTLKSNLRDDGFPGLGVPLPDLGLPRLMLGGRSVSWHHDLIIGETVERRSALIDIIHKGAGDKAMAIVKIGHDLFQGDALSAITPAVTEEQTYIMMAGTRRFQPTAGPAVPVQADHIATYVPDSTMLFQYSALGFNSHRIHIDRAYACEVEGFLDLVVNGGLATLLLTEFVRTGLKLELKSLKMKNLAPLFCDRPITIAASRAGDRWEIRIHDDKGQLAATTEVETT
jgi:3-methylfumaryl-CoA hydratase